MLWTDYFSQELYLEVSKPDEKVVHHAYFTPASFKGPLFVTHHGAGSSGLSFAILASEIRKLLPDAGILSIDARSHGETIVRNLDDLPKDRTLDVSLDTLSSDMVEVIRLTHAKLGWKEVPGLILVGHSLGGAVVTNVARQGELGDRVLGYAVLDVVEGTFTHQFCLTIWLNRRTCRLSNGRAAEHAKLPFGSSSWLSVFSLWYRVAVSSVF